MKKGIDPLWEHEMNRGGGCCSFKVEINKYYSVWEHLCLLMVCDSLTKDDEDINGISLSPKNAWTILKIWNHDKKNDLSRTLVPEVLKKYENLSIKYRANEPEY